MRTSAYVSAVSRYEPLFDEAAARGYEWQDRNVAGEPTLRASDKPVSARGAKKLVWFITKGLHVHDPRIVDATARGSAWPLSDHEAVAVAASVPACAAAWAHI